ncbi:MAG: right-handed parallel beta-helix repeat-containing protein [candidate division Zixibacteria bacterium]|nr:right-handed parallel beta-helix repeat-containing protein [candidate division Zixibacteria bacterium]
MINRKQLYFATVFLLVFALPEALNSLQGKTIFIPSPHHTTIQSAIDYSQTGDTVLVAPGIYYENLNYKGKGILVASHFILELDSSMIEKTIIDGSRFTIHAEASVVRFISGEASNSVIQGFTLRNGRGIYADEIWLGGGVSCYLSAPKIINNRIEGSEAHFGGGIGCYYGNSEPKIISNLIFNNQAVVGAGVYSKRAHPLISGNTIIQNTSSYRGGGIFVKLCSPRIKDNLVIQNSAAVHGGGIYALAVFGEIAGNLIKENRAESDGGGIYTSSESSIEISGNIIESNYSNSGGGIYNLYSTNTISNNTIIANRSADGSGGILCAGTPSYLPEIIDNIFYLNLVAIKCRDGCLPCISYNDFWGNAGGNFSCVIPGMGDTAKWVNVNGVTCDSFFNIFSDPLFSDSTYNLNCSSPCIEAGHSILLPSGRSYSDIGARDYDYLRGDVNSDGAEDISDVVFLISYLFKSGIASCPVMRGDINYDRQISIADIVVLIKDIFGN